MVWKVVEWSEAVNVIPDYDDDWQIIWQINEFLPKKA